MRLLVGGSGQNHSVVKDHRAQRQFILPVDAVYGVIHALTLIVHDRASWPCGGDAAGSGQMRFSRRTNWNTEENDLSRAHRARIAGRVADRRPDSLESDALRISL